MEYKYDKDEIKNKITVDQIRELCAELGGEPQYMGDVLVCKTICHGGNSHKLYYYDNTKLFRCYTDCGTTFDIFELVAKVKTREEHKEYGLPQALNFVAKYFGFAPKEWGDEDELYNSELWTPFNNYERIVDIKPETQEVVLKEYDNKILTRLPHPRIRPWLDEGISQEVMNYHNIAFDPKLYGIVIPHYDINNRLIGIRERAMIKENADRYGKYRPALIGGMQYNHPLGYNLYNLNNSKENIKIARRAVVFEGEKSPMLYATYFGKDNDISVATCGSSFVNYQFWLLLQLGVKEIIVAYDKQFQKIGDKEFEKLTKNFENMAKKYGNIVKISFLFDKGNLLGYKDAPIDRGKDIFEELVADRVILY